MNVLGMFERHTGQCSWGRVNGKRALEKDRLREVSGAQSILSLIEAQ